MIMMMAIFSVGMAIALILAGKFFKNEFNQNTHKTMVVKAKEYKGQEYLIVWDWKASPPWDVIMDAIEKTKRLGLDAVIYDINTRSDDHAIIVAPDYITEETAKAIYENQESHFLWDHEAESII